MLSLGVNSSLDTAQNLGFSVYSSLRNPFGLGERFTLSLGTDSSVENKQDFNAQATLPYLDTTAGGSLSLSFRRNRDRNATFFSSFDRDLTSLSLSYASSTSSSPLSALPSSQKSPSFSLSSEVSWRDETPFSVVPEDPDTPSLSPAFSALQRLRVLVSSSLSPRTPSLYILSQAQRSTKTALSLSSTLWDTRDRVADPSTGSLLTSSVELAVPPGDARYFKSDVQLQVYANLSRLWRERETERETYKERNTDREQDSDGLVFSLCSSIGLMVPLSVISSFFSLSSLSSSLSPVALSSPCPLSYLSDRYFLGGPLSLRGFSVAGVGPRALSVSSDDSLGGDTKRQLLLSLSYPLLSLIKPLSPSLSPRAVSLLNDSESRVFGFADLGSLGSSSFWESARQREAGKHPFFGHWRVSVGGGFSFVLQRLLRLELTYAVPIVYAPGIDKVKPLQLGVGLGLQV